MPTISFLPVSAMVRVALSGGLAAGLSRPIPTSPVRNPTASPRCLGNENIGGLQIVMRDALLVRGVERIANLNGVTQRFLKRQWTFKRLTLNQFHDEVIGADIVQR